MELGHGAVKFGNWWDLVREVRKASLRKSCLSYDQEDEKDTIWRRLERRYCRLKKMKAQNKVLGQEERWG